MLAEDQEARVEFDLFYGVDADRIALPEPSTLWREWETPKARAPIRLEANFLDSCAPTPRNSRVFRNAILV